MPGNRDALEHYIENSNEYLILSDLKRLGLITLNELVDLSYYEHDDLIDIAKARFGVYDHLN